MGTLYPESLILVLIVRVMYFCIYESETLEWSVHLVDIFSYCSGLEEYGKQYMDNDAHLCMQYEILESLLAYLIYFFF